MTIATRELEEATTTTAVRVSVVVPTYKRDDLLERCLEALAHQDLDPDCFEVIVVDDGRSAGTAAVVEGVCGRHRDLQVKVLEGGSLGPAAARNIGWRAAAGAVIAFTDDDAYPAFESWLQKGLAWFDDPSLNGVYGPVIVPAEEPLTDFQRNVKRLEEGRFLTCNAFYRRTALEQVNGFDERFAAPFREDSDLRFRVEALPGRTAGDEELVVYHPALPGRFGISLKLQRYSMYNALIYKKHPDRYAELHSPRPLHYYGIVLSMLVGLAAFAAGNRKLSVMAFGSWLLFEGRFFARRLKGSSREPRNILDLALTSLLIPPLSIYWRIRGAVKFRVLFF